MKVWLYYRLSRDEDDELNSLTNQRKIIYEYAVTNGHEVVGESFDDNVSGMHFNREGIDKIYEVVEAGKIEAIIVKDLSRLGRHRTPDCPVHRLPAGARCSRPLGDGKYRYVQRK